MPPCVNEFNLDRDLRKILQRQIRQVLNRKWEERQLIYDYSKTFQMLDHIAEFYCRNNVPFIFFSRSYNKIDKCWHLEKSLKFLS